MAGASENRDSDHRESAIDTMKPHDAALALGVRQGLPVALRVLADKYPRDMWAGHSNIGEMARFWLQRHDMFREIGGILRHCMDAYRAGEADAAAFQGQLIRPLQFFLTELNSHHQVEDYHYFPHFRAADARLSPGFAILDADHHAIHDSIEQTVAAANAMLKAFSTQQAGSSLLSASGAPIQKTSDTFRKAVDDYAHVSERLIAQAVAHLIDEEDLIIPLILERGEEAFGVA